MMRTGIALLVAALCAVPAVAQDDGFERVRLRVSSSAPGAAVEVDRGSSDHLEVGDQVVFFPRDGGSYRGTVTQVRDRSAIVELHERTVPELGTRGEARIPAERLRVEEPEPPEPVRPDPPKQAAEHPEWRNQDEKYTPDMPLLAQVEPLRPENRSMYFRGRLYSVGQVSHDPENGFDSSYGRLGADVMLENPFGMGGALRGNVELDALTETNDEPGVDLLARRMSYALGGHRFDDTRLEIGRFLQHGMPEFGVLDGVEWGHRRKNGDRFGASLGFMPELDEDFDSLEDLQAAAYYLATSGSREQFTYGGGFQKTYHNGKTDRDLLVLKTRYLGEDGWDFSGTAWIDFYYGRDDIKNNGIELTQAVATARKQWDSGNGFDVTFRRQRYPEILRHEFVRPVPADIANNRYDRLAWNGWVWTTSESRWHAHLSGWDDEDERGSAAELGLELLDLLASRSRTDVTAFGTAGEFSSDLGVRVSFSRELEAGYWDLFYEVAHRHHRAFPNDADDLWQHRLRASRSFYTDWGLDLSIYGEAHLWDDDLGGSLGFHMQKSF